MNNKSDGVQTAEPKNKSDFKFKGQGPPKFSNKSREGFMKKEDFPELGAQGDG